MPIPPNQLEHIRQLAAGFLGQYGREATVLVAAPGRVNLIGEHVDYNDGLVLPMGIEFYTLMAAAPRLDDAVHLSSGIDPEPVVLKLSELADKRGSHWSITSGVFWWDLPSIRKWSRDSMP